MRGWTGEVLFPTSHLLPPFLPPPPPFSPTSHLLPFMKNNFKYFKNLTVKVCKIWCYDVKMYILYGDIFWWKLIDRIF